MTQKYIKINQEQLMETCRLHFQGVLTAVKAACENLLNLDDYSEIVFDEEDLTISLYGHSVVIEPAPVPVKCIGCTREYAGFEISTFEYIHARGFEPPDFEKEQVALVRGSTQIASAVVNCLFEIKSNRYFESLVGDYEE